MGHIVVISLIVVGLPLIFICLGFFLFAMRVFRGSGKENQEQTLELAREIEKSLEKMDRRLNALEDIIMSQSKKGDKYDEL